MNSETKEHRFIELIHMLTQHHRSVTFAHDFPGMLTVLIDGDHVHLGSAHGSLKDLEKEVRNYLSEVAYEKK